MLWGRHEGARGGRLLPVCGASWVGRSPNPDCPPSGRAAGAHYPLAVGAGGCVRGDASPTPQRALLCAGFVRRGNGTRAPEGGASCLGVGRPGLGALPPPTAALWAGCWGPLPTRCGCGGPRSWGPVTNPTARALASWFCALWGRHEGARRGRPLLGFGASGVGHSPTPKCPPSGRAAGAHYPLAVGAGGCGRGDPSPTPQRALLRAVGAASGCPGGAHLAWVWGVRRRALSHPRLSALWVGCRGPLPTHCGCGGVRAWGPVTNPGARPLASWLCALWWRHKGARGGRLLPGCGASRVGRSPTPVCPPSRQAAGAHYPLAVGAGGCGRGNPSPTPQRALLRAGFARCGGGTRVPGGSACCLGVGRRGSGALPPPTARSLGGLPGPTTHLLWVRWGAGMGARYQPHSARSCELVLHAVGAARGRPGGAPPAWVWASGVGRSPNPRLPALWAGCWGKQPTCCGCGGVRALGPVTNPTARALACCGGGMRVPGGRAPCLGVGRPGLGALPSPTTRPLGGLPGPTTHWLWVRGGAGVGTRHQPRSARSCELALRAAGEAGGCPGGAPLACVWGVRGRALSQPRLPALWAGCRGPLPTGCGCGGVRAWGPVTDPTAGALASWLCALWGRHEGARGKRLLPGCGASGVRRSPTPDCPPSGRAARAHYPLAVGAMGCGHGGPLPTPHRALLRAGFARCGGGKRAPGGGASCLGVGRPGSGALQTPDCPPSGRAAGANNPLAVGAGGCGRWDPSPTPQRALLRTVEAA